MRTIRFLAPAAAFLSAAMLFAQAPGPGGPTTGGKAPSVPKVIFPTDPPRTTSTTSTFPPLVFQQTGVPKDLGVNSRQQTQIDTMTQQLQAKFQAQYDRLNGLPATERADRLTQLNRDYAAAWLDGARGIFNEQQLTRYQQLQLQYGGFAALMDPVSQKALGLTDAQMKQLRQDIAWSTEQQAAIQQAAQADQARALQLFNTYNTTAQTRFNQLLNMNQQQMWSQMIGSPFAFQPSFAPPPGTTGTTVTGPGGTPIAPGNTGPGTTGPGTTGPSTAPRPGAPGPTTGGTMPPGGPTTGGTMPPGGPTTGGTAPGKGPGGGTPPKG